MYIYDCAHLNYLCKNVSHHVYVSFSYAYFMYIIHTLMCVRSYKFLCFLFAYMYTRLCLCFYICIGLEYGCVCCARLLHFIFCIVMLVQSNVFFWQWKAVFFLANKFLCVWCILILPRLFTFWTICSNCDYIHLVFLRLLLITNLNLLSLFHLSYFSSLLFSFCSFFLSHYYSFYLYSSDISSFFLFLHFSLFI